MQCGRCGEQLTWNPEIGKWVAGLVDPSDPETVDSRAWMCMVPGQSGKRPHDTGDDE